MIKKLGRYSIEEEVGRGGMGVVYRARDERLGKTVAVKVLSQPPSSSSASIDSKGRFRREARAAATLTHPSIVSVFDYDEDEGVPFIVYEFVEGTRLDRLIARGKTGEAQALDIASQLAQALAYAHEHGIIHRDIKPQNIVVTADGQAKILDFGLAKKTGLQVVSDDGDTVQPGASFETVRGTILGTVQYMSPEQVAGETLDGRTDIFSLGIVIYEMLTGINPFQTGSVASTIGKIMSPEPPETSLPGLTSAPLRAILSRALQKRRENRYQDAKAMADDLLRLRNVSLGVATQPTGAVEPQTEVIPRQTSRVLMLLLQALYLGVYGTALYFLGDVVRVLQDVVREFITSDPVAAARISRALFSLMLVTGCCGIAVRLFLIASIVFDDPETGLQYRRIFPFVFVLDEIWALAPLLLGYHWRVGLTLLCCACLAYLPMSQRTLVRSAYPSARTGSLFVSRKNSPHS